MRQSNSQLQLNIYYYFFGLCGVCYTFAVDYRKQTVAMIKQNIKKYYELEGFGEVSSVNMEFA